MLLLIIRELGMKNECLMTLLDLFELKIKLIFNAFSNTKMSNNLLTSLSILKPKKSFYVFHTFKADVNSICMYANSFTLYNSFVNK